MLLFLRGYPNALELLARYIQSEVRYQIRPDAIITGAEQLYDYQRELFHKKLAAGQPIDGILAVIAAPGFSQHHTGCAVDVGAPGCESLTEDFEQTNEFHWLVQHAKRFAFSMPYPRNNQFGFIYEPWHWAHATIGI